MLSGWFNFGNFKYFSSIKPNNHNYLEHRSELRSTSTTLQRGSVMQEIQIFYFRKNLLEPRRISGRDVFSGLDLHSLCG